MAPPWMLVAKLPGSTYATAATKAGPSIASVARTRPRASSRSSGLASLSGIVVPSAVTAGRNAAERRRRSRPARLHRRQLDPHRPGERARRDVHLGSPKRTNSGPSNGCLSTTSSPSPGAIPRSARNRSISGSESETRVKRAAVARLAASAGSRVPPSSISAPGSGSGRRGDRAWDRRAWPRSAPRAPRRARARAPRPRRGRGPTGTPRLSTR